MKKSLLALAVLGAFARKAALAPASPPAMATLPSLDISTAWTRCGSLPHMVVTP